MSCELGEFVCRACLQEDELMVDIYEHVEELQLNLCELLEDCGGIKVLTSDTHPKYLCQQCTQELLISAKFRIKCLQTEEKLKHVINENQELLEVCTTDVEEEEEQEEIIDFNPNDEMQCHEIVVSNEETTYEETIEEEPIKQSEFSAPKTNFVCDDCGAVFQQALTLRRHIEKVHSVRNIYSCDQCGYCYTQSSNLRIHNCIAVAPRPEDNNYNNYRHRCMYCGKYWPTPFSLAAHLRHHTGERPFSCDVCSKTFKTNAALVGHQKSHMQLAKYQCPHCDKRFVDGNNMRRHVIALHTNDRPHECTVCQRSFSRVYLLELHMRTHTGEKPYECSVCQKRFAQSSVLRNHERIHTGERYCCNLCSKTFARVGQLKQHQHHQHHHHHHEDNNLSQGDQQQSESISSDVVIDDYVGLIEEVVSIVDTQDGEWCVDGRLT